MEPSGIVTQAPGKDADLLISLWEAGIPWQGDRIVYFRWLDAAGGAGSGKEYTGQPKGKVLT